MGMMGDVGGKSGAPSMGVMGTADEVSREGCARLVG
jgi:hypothetical protein